MLKLYFILVDIPIKSNRAMTPKEFEVLRQELPKIMDNFDPMFDNLLELSKEGFGFENGLPNSIEGILKSIENLDGEVLLKVWYQIIL